MKKFIKNNPTTAVVIGILFFFVVFPILLGFLTNEKVLYDGRYDSPPGVWEDEFFISFKDTSYEAVLGSPLCAATKLFDRNNDGKVEERQLCLSIPFKGYYCFTLPVRSIDQENFDRLKHLAHIK